MEMTVARFAVRLFISDFEMSLKYSAQFNQMLLPSVLLHFSRSTNDVCVFLKFNYGFYEQISKKSKIEQIKCDFSKQN